MQPFLIPYEVDGDKILYTTYFDDREVNGVVKIGQPIDLDSGLPRVEEDEPESE